MTEDTILVRANPQQTKASLLQRYDPDGPISLAQHTERADILGGLDYSRDKQIYWALVPKDTPGTEYILSTVSTIVRTVLVQRETNISPGSEIIDHSPTRRTAFAITHVYTPEKLRKKGYATWMMSLLHLQLAESTTASQTSDLTSSPYPKGILSFLYSGVGDFYSRCGPPGWHIQTSTETYWTTSSLLKERQSNSSDGSSAKWLTEQQFTEIAERDALLLTEELTSRSRAGEAQAFAVLPTGEEYTWLVARSKFYGGILSPHPLPIHWGFQADADNFAIWFIDYVKKELHFLRLRCVDSLKLKSIIHAAAKVASEQGCEKILAWNLDERLLRDVQSRGEGVTHEARTKNLAAVAWYGVGECPSWLANEKYGWC
ncbi:hypothetical protein B0H34DRAFT_719879 [Crassisporium funariophilum]|nr:hypothetical protein B0H34DRAFT_719879 [Crassisporium funariophilum]